MSGLATESMRPAAWSAGFFAYPRCLSCAADVGFANVNPNRPSEVSPRHETIRNFSVISWVPSYQHLEVLGINHWVWKVIKSMEMKNQHPRGIPSSKWYTVCYVVASHMISATKASLTKWQFWGNHSVQLASIAWNAGSFWHPALALKIRPS